MGEIDHQNYGSKILIENDHFHPETAPYSNIFVSYLVKLLWLATYITTKQFHVSGLGLDRINRNRINDHNQPEIAPNWHMH